MMEIVLVDHAARTARPAPLGHPGRSRLGDLRMDRRLLQPRPTPHQHRRTIPSRVRNPSQPRRYRGMITTPTVSGRKVGRRCRRAGCADAAGFRSQGARALPKLGRCGVRTVERRKCVRGHRWRFPTTSLPPPAVQTRHPIQWEVIDLAPARSLTRSLCRSPTSQVAERWRPPPPWWQGLLSVPCARSNAARRVRTLSAVASMKPSHRRNQGALPGEAPCAQMNCCTTGLMSSG